MGWYHAAVARNHAAIDAHRLERSLHAANVVDDDKSMLDRISAGRGAAREPLLVTIRIEIEYLADPA